MSLVLTLCKYYHWEPNFWRRMGRRYFYAVIDETYRREQRNSGDSVGSWRGYENNAWYQQARERTGRKPLTRA